MKLYKATAYFFSLENDIDHMRWQLENLQEMFIELFNIESAEIGPWHDDISINKAGSTEEDYKELFSKEEQLKKLKEEKEYLVKQINSIDNKIDQLGISRGDN